MKHLNSVSFQGKRALVRVDFNVPLNDQFQVTDNTRIRRAVPTLKHILSDGGSCIVMSHLGRPKGEANLDFSLKHIVSELSNCLGTEVQFVPETIGSVAIDRASKLQPGEVLLIENTRFQKQETDGDQAFAHELSKLGDVYVNDAFGTAHRAHASTTTVASFFEADAKCFGLLMGAEVENASKVLNSAHAPFTAILGGAKVSDKIELISNLMKPADHIIIGGGMAYTFMKAQDGNIGNSLVEDDKLDLARSLLDQTKEAGCTLHLPVDSVSADQFSKDANTEVQESMSIKDGWMGLDIGPRAVEVYCDVIASSKTILWNGPMGVFEMEKFQQGTKAIGEAVAKATRENGAFSLVGGGDSVAAVSQFNLSDGISYVSTGGGAMLTFFEGKTLPGVAAIAE